MSLLSPAFMTATSVVIAPHGFIGSTSLTCKKREPHSYSLPVCCMAGTKSASSPSSLTPTSDRPPQPPNSRLISALSVGEEFVGTVVEIGGADSLWLDLRVVHPARGARWRSVQARLRFDKEYFYTKAGKLSKRIVKPREKPGEIITVRIMKVQPASARLEVERVSPVPGIQRLPPKAPTKRALPRREASPAAVLLDDLEIGQRLNGTVVRTTEAGAVLDCCTARRGRNGKTCEALGLLSRKRFPEGWSSSADKVVRDDSVKRVGAGDSLTVYVRGVHPANGFLWLAAEPVDLAELEAERRAYKAKVRRKRKLPRPDSLSVGQELQGVVRETAKFGAFVDIGTTTDGLIHFSCMGKKYRVGWEDNVVVGRPVLVKVRDVTKSEKKFRISLELLALGDEDIASLKVEAEHYAVASEETGTGVFARPVKSVGGATETKNNESEEGEEDKKRNDVDDGDEGDDFDITDEYLDDKYGDY